MSRLKSKEILAKSMLKLTKNLKILKSLNNFLKLVTPGYFTLEMLTVNVLLEMVHS